MKLFYIRENKVYPTDECLRVEEFKTLWDRDSSKLKNTAIKELSYIEFLYSYLDTNPYSEYEESEKEEKIILDLFGNKKWKPDKEILLAVEKYIEFRDNASVSLRFYKSNVKAIEKLRTFLETVDFHDRTKGGAAVYKPGDISKALRESNDVLSSLQKLKERIQKENFENSKIKGGKKVSYFEK